MTDGFPDRITQLRARWQADPSSRVFLQLAEEYRHSGRVQDALAVLESGLKEHPGYLSALVAQGRCLLELGDAGKARGVLERVVQQDATQMVASKLLVRAYIETNDPEHARQRLDLYRLLNDSDPEIDELHRRVVAMSRPPQAPDGPRPEEPAERPRMDSTETPAAEVFDLGPAKPGHSLAAEEDLFGLGNLPATLPEAPAGAAAAPAPADAELPAPAAEVPPAPPDAAPAPAAVAATEPTATAPPAPAAELLITAGAARGGAAGFASATSAAGTPEIPGTPEIAGTPVAAATPRTHGFASYGGKNGSDPFPDPTPEESRRRYLAGFAAEGIFSFPGGAGEEEPGPGADFAAAEPGAEPGAALAAMASPVEAPSESPAPPAAAGSRATLTLGELYLRQGHFEEAERIFGEVAQRDPGNAAARDALAEIARRAQPARAERPPVTGQPPAPALVEAAAATAGQATPGQGEPVAAAIQPAAVDQAGSLAAATLPATVDQAGSLAAATQPAPGQAEVAAAAAATAAVAAAAFPLLSSAAARTPAAGGEPEPAVRPEAPVMASAPSASAQAAPAATAARQASSSPVESEATAARPAASAASAAAAAVAQPAPAQPMPAVAASQPAAAAASAAAAAAGRSAGEPASGSRPRPLDASQLVAGMADPQAAPTARKAYLLQSYLTRLRQPRSPHVP